MYQRLRDEPERGASEGKAGNINYGYTRDETDVFTGVPFDLSVKPTNIVEYFPLTSISDVNAPLVFEIKSTDSHYIELDKTVLKLKCKILTAAGTPVEAAKVVVPVNNLFYSMFKNCSVYLNESLITPATQLYAYRAYMEQMLAYSKDYKKSQARCHMFYREKDPTSTSTTEDGGFKTRYELTKESKLFEMLGRPCSDIFYTDKFLIPGVDMRLQFDRSLPEFCLISTTSASEKFVISIEEAKLRVVRHVLHPSLVQNHIRMLRAGKPVLYPLDRVELKSMTIVPGTLQVHNESLVQGQLPSRVLVALLKSKNQVGTLESSPFIFDHNNLKHINIVVNGDQTTGSPIEMDYENDLFMDAYYNMFYGLGITGEDHGVDLDLETFKKGFCVYVFNLGYVKNGFAAPSFGNMMLSLKFATAPAAALTCLVYCEYVACLQVSHNRAVSFKDLSA